MLSIKNLRVPDEARTAIVTNLITHGVSRDRANETVDLAVFAAERAMSEVLEISGRGSAFGVQAGALEIGVQILRSHCDRVHAAMRAVGQDRNVATTNVEVAL